MIKTMLKLAVIVLVALGIAELGRLDPGYILINYSGYIIETSLLVVVIFAVIAVILFSVLMSFVMPVWKRLLPAHHKNQDKSAQLLTRGLLNLADGHWKTARKYLKRVSSRSPLSLAAQMGAARAAYELGDMAEAQSHLDKAKKLDSLQNEKYKHHILLVESQLSFNNQDYDGAMQALNKISAAHQNEVFWTLKASVLKQTAQWHQLYSILPKLRQDKLVREDELLLIESQCFTALTENQTLETINEFWKSVPSKQKQLSPMALARFNALKSIHEDALAYEVLQEQIQRGVDTQWALQLANETSTDWQTRFNLLTKYMGNQTEDHQVLKALGYIALQGQQQNQALEFLNKAVALDPKDLKTHFLIFEIEKELNKDISAEQQLAKIAAHEQIEVR